LGGAYLKVTTAMNNIIRCIFISIIALMISGLSSAQVIDIETFGTGTYPGAPLPAEQTTYNYNAPAQPADFPDILQDGDYVIATNSQQGFTSWASVNDHTSGSGFMMLVNADDNQSGEFYRRQVSLTANTSYDFLAFLVNVNSQGDFDFCTANEGGLVLPNVTLQIEDGGGGMLATFDTGDIPFNPVPVWDGYGLTFTTSASTTSVEVVLINNSLGGCGNDLAIDDITFRVAVTMEAFDDSATVTDTSTPQSAVVLVGANDTLDGNPLTGTENYSVAPLSTLPSGFTLDGNTGQVDVAAGTPEGIYSFDYEVCETSNMYNCDIATVTITIEFPPATITAVNDSGSVADSSLGFTAVLNVLDNDTIDGVSPPAQFDLSVSAGSSLPPQLTFDTSTGAVGVVQNAPTNSYSFDYDICEQGDPNNCETATVTINVTNPGGGSSFCPMGTTATSGTFHVVSATAQQTGHNPERTIGLPEPEGSTQTGDNTATFYSDEIIMDLTGDASILVPEGETIEVSLTSAWSTLARAEVLMSADGVTYTSLGTTGDGGSVYGAWSANIMRYDDFVVPSGGARYLQVAHENDGVRADGVIYTTQCQPTPTTLTASKTIANYDPNNSGLYSIPGNDVIYTINVASSGSQNIADGSMLLIDILPSELSFFNGDVDGPTGPETDPVSFTDNSSGLTFTYATDVGYSQSSTTPVDFSECNYAPIANSYDPATNFICFNPKGSMLPNSDWSVSFRMQIK